MAGAPPIIEPMLAPTHAALASRLLQLQQDVAELRAIVVRRPLTETEIDDPASIPADALSSLSDVPLDLENVSEEKLNAWVSGYIDGTARYDESSESIEANQPAEAEDARAKGASGRGQRRKRSREMSRG
jgi:type IV secretion system protein VirD4